MNIHSYHTNFKTCVCNLYKRIVGIIIPVKKNNTEINTSNFNKNLPVLEFLKPFIINHDMPILDIKVQRVFIVSILSIISLKSIIGYSICSFGHGKYSKKTVPVAPVVAGLFLIYLLNKSQQNNH